VQASLSIPFTEPVTVLFKAQCEMVTPFSNNHVTFWFSPFHEYSPSASSSPVIIHPVDAFHSKYITLTGVISLDPDITASPYPLAAVAVVSNFDDPPEAGMQYGGVKLVAVVGAYTGENSVVF
jgi:hypothetical protein